MTTIRMCISSLTIFGRNGRAWREADVEATDPETVILDMLEGRREGCIPRGVRYSSVCPYPR
jgi:hypothetical protein